MTMDRSLKVAGGLNRHNNVLSRAARIQKLIEQGRFDPETDKALALPKVSNRKVSTGKKSSKKADDEATA